MDAQLICSKDFDDRFAIDFLWRKDNLAPLRVRLAYCSPEWNEISFELPAEDVSHVFLEALQDAKALCEREVNSSLESLQECFERDGNSLAVSSSFPQATEASA